MIRRGFMVCVFLLAMPTGVLAGSYGTELPFVLGSGARSSALGRSGVTFSSDASVQVLNPAGLSGLQWKQVTFFRTSLFDADATYHAVTYSHPLLNAGTFGVSLLRLGVGGIEQRDENNQLLSSDLGNSQTRVLLGFAKPVTKTISAGLNIKIDHQSFGSNSGTGIGMDVGVMATQPIKNHGFMRAFRQGLSLRNVVEPSVKLAQESVQDPLEVAAGVGLLSSIGGTGLATSIDLVRPRFSPTHVRLGQEITYSGAYSLRLGLDDGRAAYGFGAIYKGVSLDYAYQDFDIGNNHRVSISYRFGKSLDDRQTDRHRRLEQQVSERISERMVSLERSQIETALANARKYRESKRFEQAVRQYETALIWDPDNQDIQAQITSTRYEELISQAGRAWDRNEYARVIDLARGALEFKTGDDYATRLVMQANRKISESKEVTEHVNSLVKSAIDHYAQAQYSRALTTFESVLSIDTQHALATEYRQKCIQQIGWKFRDLKRRGETAFQQGRYEDAINRLTGALRVQPDDRDVAELLARAREQKTKRESQVKPAVPVVTSPPRVQKPMDGRSIENYRRGMVAIEQGNFAAAAEMLKSVWVLNPGYNQVTALLTRAYLLHGIQVYANDEYDAAIRLWRQALTIDPNNDKARRYLQRADAELKALSENP